MLANTMDPYTSALYGIPPASSATPANASSSSASSGPGTSKLLLFFLLFVVVIAGGFLFWKSGQDKAQAQQAAAAADAQRQQMQVLPPPAPPVPGTTTSVDYVQTRAPDYKLTSFGFEPMTMPGKVPDLTGTLSTKPAGNPVYAFVQCGASASSVAVRYQNRFLTVIDDRGQAVQWTDAKQEPNSCWTIVPGYCPPSSDHVMLRSNLNGKFLRFDASSLKMVCVDAPTQRTSSAFCWLFRGAAPASIKESAACGCEYSPSVGGILCHPCQDQPKPQQQQRPQQQQQQQPQQLRPVLTVAAGGGLGQRLGA